MEDYRGMIVLHGNLFKFDQQRKNIIETANPTNTKRIDQLDQDEKFVYIYFDSNRNKLMGTKDIQDAGIDKRQLPLLTVPREVIYHGNRLSDWSIGVYNTTSFKNKTGFYYMDQALDFRLMGYPAAIELSGFPYYLDFNKLEIYRKHRPQDAFYFSPEAIFKEEIKLFHSRCRRPVYKGELMKGDTESIVCLKFPPLADLDLFGYCQHIGISPLATLATSPLQPDVNKITVVPSMEIVKKIQDQNIAEHKAWRADHKRKSHMGI
jgi:hypothetical protein